MFVRASLSAFAHRGFRAIWIASLFSNMGSWIEDVGEAWLMVEMHGTPLMVSLVSVTGVLPVVVLSLPAGALADQVDRRRFLLVTQSWMAASALGLAWISWMHWVQPWSLLLFTTALGVGLAANGPAYQSLVPELVPAADLPQAVALNSLNFNLGRAVGPAIGGLMVAAMGASATFLLNALSFVGVLVMIRRMPPLPPKRARVPMRRAMTDGLAFAAKSVELRTTYLGVAIHSVPSAVTAALLPTFAASTLRADSFGFGMLMTSVGIGASLGAVMLPRTRSRWAPRQVLPVTMATYGTLLFALSFARDLHVATLILCPMGAMQLMTVSSFNALTHVHAPPQLRGRLMALYTVSFLGSLSLGGTIGGALANHLGVPSTYRLAAAGIYAASLTAAFLPIPTLVARAASDTP